MRIAEDKVAARIIHSLGRAHFARRRNATVLVVGAGALGSKIALALVRFGYNVFVVDPDIVEAHNLPFQEFTSKDIGRPKAEALVRRAHLIAPFSTRLGFANMHFAEAVRNNVLPNCSVAIAVPDNNLTRLEVAHYFYAATPVVFAGISEDGRYGYVFIQRPGQACIQCAFPTMTEALAVAQGCGGLHSGDGIYSHGLRPLRR